MSPRGQASTRRLESRGTEGHKTPISRQEPPGKVTWCSETKDAFVPWDTSRVSVVLQPLSEDGQLAGPDTLLLRSDAHTIHHIQLIWFCECACMCVCLCVFLFYFMFMFSLFISQVEVACGVFSARNCWRTSIFTWKAATAVLRGPLWITPNHLEKKDC